MAEPARKLALVKAPPDVAPARVRVVYRVDPRASEELQEILARVMSGSLQNSG